MRQVFVLPIALFVGLALASIGHAGQYIHPYNKVLMKLYPRPFKLYFPDVPRITAWRALSLYRTGRAFFIHIGAEGGDVPGGLHFRESEAWRIDPNVLLRTIPRYKLVILYCA